MQIEVQGASWGSASSTAVKIILENAAEHLLRYFRNISIGKIQVQCNQTADSPQVFYRCIPTADYVVWLDAQDCYWCRYSYQFAHELCHILSDFEKFSSNSNKWFHESLCELASIFVIKQMAVSWRTAPPYSGGNTFAESLEKYAHEKMTRESRQLPNGITLGEWFRGNEPLLRSNYYIRDLNGLVAVQMLSILENSPEHWQCICYLPNSDDVFEKYLSLWHQACIEPHRLIIRQISELFGMQIYE